MNAEIEKNMNKYEENLSKFACKNSSAIRFKEENKSDIRTPFFRDIDRIIYTLSYLRYIDKTQVFTFKENDNISRRMTHVQMVAKIARTIGRALNLNEDLIEAAALGHDLGHVPFGHEGEYILNDLSKKHGEGFFNHNIQSVRILMYLEDNGKGKNITLQTLDAIMCHNGEFLLNEYYPKKKTKEEFLEEYNSSYKVKDITKTFIPLTLEGCVVRISDVIAYIGKDIEDAIRIGIFSKKDLPKNIISVLGDNNKDIVNTIILDVINNSINKPYLKMSKKVYEALTKLKDFNYKNIYAKANTKEELNLYQKIFKTVFESSLKDLEDNNKKSDIYRIYLKDMDKKYLENNTNARKVIDYIAGMTDDFIKNQYEKIINNK